MPTPVTTRMICALLSNTFVKNACLTADLTLCVIVTLFD